MPINFSPGRWENIKKNYTLWWEGKLDRPVIPVLLSGRDAGRAMPQVPLLSQLNCNDLSVSASDIIDRIDYELSTYEYLGDSFPYFNMDAFGPGVTAAFLGAELDNSTGRVWFHAKEILPVSELHFEYDDNNVWLNRVREICEEAVKRWQGQVLLGMPDLGGVLDILSTFRSADNLLIDLYDEPDEVKRLVWEIYELWHRFYNEISKVLQKASPGFSDWSQLYSEVPSYVIQSDFSYMISPSMFDEFTKPELEATCSRLPRTIYHLDGIGQLGHLDSLLEIDKLNAVQWVPGDGKPDQSGWPEVYRKIHAAGKNIQLFHGFNCIDAVIEQIGTGNGIHHMIMRMPFEKKVEMDRKLAKYGIE